jgi:hypothetical protein
MKKLFTILIAIWINLSSTAHATLVSRGDGMVFDTVLAITWLQDTNYAKSSGYTTIHADPNTNISKSGRMGWESANVWANTLVYGGYSDWRLPTFSNTTTCSGVGCTDSELGYMFYTNFAAKPNSDFSTGDNVGNLDNLSLFNNFENYAYWFMDEYDPNTQFRAWAFGLNSGIQTDYNKGSAFYGWAVRSGDVKVSSVPVPAAIWLFTCGLISLSSLRRKYK